MQVWVAGGSRNNLLIFSCSSHELVLNFALSSDSGVRRILYANGQVWLGHRDGSIRVVDSQELEFDMKLNAHFDTVRSMCTALQRYVISGSASKDGGVVVWNANSSTC